MAENPIERFISMRDRSPEEAKFFWSGGSVELAENVWFQSMFSGTTAFETDEGIVLVDSGLERLAPQIAAMLREKTKAPIHTAIFTQGHVDHAFGLKHFLVEGQKPPQVIAHRAMTERFKRYQLTAGHNIALNARQFRGTAEHGSEHPDTYNAFKNPPEFGPNRFYEDRLDIEVGGLSFEIHHCLGETDDHSWIFCPEKGVLCPGDLFIWSVPNAGNPQKVQRFALPWARGLREMVALKPVSLGPGHGGPVVRDGEKLERMLLETADFLEEIHDRTVAVMNAGSPPHVDIVCEVELPQSDSPWLQPVYDDGEFIVRNIIRLYGGWWTGRPSELKPAPRAVLAQAVADLTQGAVGLADYASKLAKRDLKLACHFADFALEADPQDKHVQEKVAEIYDKRAKAEESFMSTNIFHSAASYARSGKAFR